MCCASTLCHDVILIVEFNENKLLSQTNLNHFVNTLVPKETVQQFDDVTLQKPMKKVYECAGRLMFIINVDKNCIKVIAGEIKG